MKLTLKQPALILGVSPVTITRLSVLDSTFPKLERIGRSIFIDSGKFYSWLSVKAGETITSSDRLMKSRDIEAYYQKSRTWVWKQCKAGNLPKPFKINRTNYWVERVIVGEIEGQSWRNGGFLSSFLEFDNIKTIIYFLSKVVIFCVRLFQLI